MRLIKYLYKKIKKKDPPYYYNYSILKCLWIPIRKFINVVIIPNLPINTLRILFYRMLGYKIGKNVFIGMKCYLDDLEPQKTIIGNNVTISYGTYFAVHGKGQSRTTIQIGDNVYVGMCSRLIGGKDGIKIGDNVVIGACTLVNKSLPPNSVCAGVPVKIIKYN